MSKGKKQPDRRLPHQAKIYLLLAAFFIALPSLNKLYTGYTGKLLVSTSLTRGTEFQRSVVYMEKHSLFSAHGVIINKRGVDGLDVNYGGPVETEKRFILKQQEDGEISLNLFEGPEAGEWRIFRGFAGWGPFQMNIERMKGAWDIIEAEPALIFGTPPDDIYDAAKQRVPAKSIFDDEKVL